jgi:hypothetical protein
MGAMLVASFLEISQTSASLRLLNGRENPKLKHLLEWRLVSAVGASRKYVESDPAVDPVALPNLVPNWIHTVDGARALIVARDLEHHPPIAGDVASQKPLENLQVIREWIARHDGGRASQQ